MTRLTTLPDDEELGPDKANRLPVPNREEYISSDEWNALKARVIELATVIGLEDGSTSGSIEELLDTLGGGEENLGFPFRQVRAAAHYNDGNVNLSSDVEAGDTFFGVTLAEGDVILVCGQSTPLENGPWVVAASGSPSRPSWWTTADSLGMMFFVTDLDADHFSRRFQVTYLLVAGGEMEVRHIPRVLAAQGAFPTSAFAYPDVLPGDIHVDESLGPTPRAFVYAGTDAGSGQWKLLGGGRQKSISGTTHTITQDDIGDTLFFTNSSAITVTFNNDAIKGVVTLIQDGAGTVTISAGTGTLVKPSSGAYATAEQYDGMTLICRNGTGYVYNGIGLGGD